MSATMFPETVLEDRALLEPAEMEPEVLEELEKTSSEKVPEWALARARSGAAWLDSKYGTDWDRQIDFARLDIGSPIWCIVGQLIRHGYLGLMFATSIVEHGFSRGLLDIVVVLLPIGLFKRGYRPLTDAWKQVLRERRGPKEPHVVRSREFSSVQRARRGDFTQAV
jgi:hypothetical protein